MSRTHTVLDSPLGPLTVVAQDGALAGLYLPDQQHRPADVGDPGPGVPGLVEQLQAYFLGDLQTFEVPFAEVGTPFQRRVWQALRAVPYGTTTTYGALAAEIGAPAAARAVGMANSRNPRCIVVPCHRVVGADGSLTGYSGGVGAKRALLRLEGVSTD